MAVKEVLYDGKKLYVCTLCPRGDSFKKADVEEHTKKVHPGKEEK